MPFPAAEPSGSRVLSSPPVVRFVVVALLSFFLAQESSLGSLLAGAACPETCPDDAPGGRCSPVCVACSCGTRLNPFPPRVARLEAPAPRDAFELATPAAPPAEGHPAEIAHVPIGASS
jgi:hypothetical protein